MHLCLEKTACYPQVNYNTYMHTHIAAHKLPAVCKQRSHGVWVMFQHILPQKRSVMLFLSTLIILVQNLYPTLVHYLYLAVAGI